MSAQEDTTVQMESLLLLNVPKVTTVLIQGLDQLMIVQFVLKVDIVLKLVFLSQMVYVTQDTIALQEVIHLLHQQEET